MGRIHRAATAAGQFQVALLALKPYPEGVQRLANRTTRVLEAMRTRYDALDRCVVRTFGTADCQPQLAAARSTYLEGIPAVVRAWAS